MRPQRIAQCRRSDASVGHCPHCPKDRLAAGRVLQLQLACLHAPAPCSRLTPLLPCQVGMLVAPHAMPPTGPRLGRGHGEACIAGAQHVEGAGAGPSRAAQGHATGAAADAAHGAAKAEGLERVDTRDGVAVGSRLDAQARVPHCVQLQAGQGQSSRAQCTQADQDPVMGAWLYAQAWAQQCMHPLAQTQQHV